jgi:hypothetical protein
MASTVGSKETYKMSKETYKETYKLALSHTFTHEHRRTRKRHH